MVRGQPSSLGFSVHTGWASLLAVAGAVDAPDVVDRRRVELLAGRDADARRFVYHLASELSLPAAKSLVDRTTAAVRDATLSALRSAIAELEARGLRVEQAAIIGGGAGVKSSLAEILRSHAAIHAAEGELYRDSVAAACKALRVKIVFIRARELPETAARNTGITTEKMARYMADLKRLLGPPWGEDQKQAMLAAWSALGAGDVKPKPTSGDSSARRKRS